MALGGDIVPGSSPFQNDPFEFTGSWSQMEEQRSLETVESRSPYSQLLIWPDFQGLTPTRWGPGLASLERPHSVLGKLGPLTGGFFAHQPHAGSPEVVLPAPRSQDSGLASGPMWEAPMGLYRPMAPATRGQQGSTGSRSEPELSGGLPEGGSISQVPQQPLRPMRALSTMGCTGCGAWLWVILFQKVALLRIRNATSRPSCRKQRDLENVFSSLSVL